MITGYHSHIYFDSTDIEIATHLRNTISEMSGVKVGKMHDKPIGPHTKPMFTVEIKPDVFSRLVPFLMINRNNLDVLVHPETGNDLLDHTNHALWLGNKVPLDLSKL